MVTREQALDVLSKIRESKPAKFFNKIDETNAGMNFILAYLNEHDNDIYASEIADNMQISRARVTVLIQKLINKGLIIKSNSRNDARIEVLKLTQSGFDEINKFLEHMISDITKVIEVIGLEEMYKFIETSVTIKNLLDNLE